MKFQFLILVILAGLCAGNTSINQNTSKQQTLSDLIAESSIDSDDTILNYEFKDGTSATFLVSGEKVELLAGDPSTVDAKLQDCDCGLPQERKFKNSQGGWDCSIQRGIVVCSCTPCN